MKIEVFFRLINTKSNVRDQLYFLFCEGLFCGNKGPLRIFDDDIFYQHTVDADKEDHMGDSRSRRIV